MFTIMTQTNRAAYKYGTFEKQKVGRKWKNDVNLEQVWVQDRQIERKLFEVIREFTTFTLNKDTFIHVFVESQTTNQYRLGETRSHPSNKHHQGAQSQSNEDFGFCLIKLKWIASNIAECHLGFYQVGPKSRLKFIKSMRKYLNSQKQTPMDQNMRLYLNQECEAGFTMTKNGQKSAPFFCYTKNIPSLLMRLPQRQLSKQKKLEKHYLDNAFNDHSDQQQLALPVNGAAGKESKESKRDRRAFLQQQEQAKAQEMHA